MTELSRRTNVDVNDLGRISYFIPFDVLVNGDVITIPLMPADVDPSVRGETRDQIVAFLENKGFKEGVELIGNTDGSPVVDGKRVDRHFVKNHKLTLPNS